MAVSKNFLPKFEVSDNLANDLKNIEISKAMSAGWYKGKWDYYLRKLGYVTIINGEEYYKSAYGDVRGHQVNFFNKGTQGYYMAEFFRLLGMQDEDLRQLQVVSGTNKVDGVYHAWKAKGKMSNQQFKNNIANLASSLSGVTTIEIDYENQRYKNSDFPLETSRIYNTKESIYGNALQYAEKHRDLDTDGWTEDGRVFTLDSIQNKSTLFSFGKEIRFMNGLVDVTDSYSNEVIFAVQTMITYSGTQFMSRISSVKTGEMNYSVQQYTPDNTGTIENYTSVIGTETYNATISLDFIADSDNRQYRRYTCFEKNGVCGQNSEEIEGRTRLQKVEEIDGNTITTYTNAFWQYVDFITQSNVDELEFSQNAIVNTGDEFLFHSTGDRNLGAYIKVSEFKKLSLDEIGNYIGEYFDIRVTRKKGGWFSGFIGTVAGFLGKVFNFIYDIFTVIPILRIQLQVLTIIVNKTFGSDLTEKEVFSLTVQIIWTIIAIVFAPVTFGASLAISAILALAIAGSKAEDAKTEEEKKAEAEKKKKETENEERKKEQEAEEMRKQINNEETQNEQEEFQAFLKNPLYKVDREKNEMKNEFEKQFKLL